MIYIRIILFYLSIGIFNITLANSLEILVAQGQQNMELGFFVEAERKLALAEGIAEQQKSIYNLTLIRGLKGYIAIQQRNSELAELLLTKALNESKKNQWHNLSTRLQLYLAQLHAQQNNLAQAKQYLMIAVSNPEKVTEKSLLVSGYYQLAKVAIANEQNRTASQYLTQAKSVLLILHVSQTTSQLWLNLGYQYLKLYQLDTNNEDALEFSFIGLKKALEQARQFGQQRVQVSALKHLSVLYINQNREDDALKLLLEGIKVAQKIEAEDLLIDLETQLALIYKLQNKRMLAIGAYRRAVRHIEKVRIDIPVTYEQGRSSFRDTLAPIYLGLADLLLQQSSFEQKAEQQTLLKEAQNTIELMKQSELEDYFQSRCDIATTPINLKKKDIHAAAIYPIQLADRLDIIVYTAEGLHRFSSTVNAKMLEEKAQVFSTQLRNYAEEEVTKRHAKVLFQWLIEPISSLLQEQKIETLIFMPDGALRLFPLGALHNGNNYLIEDYAVVTSPGMSLIESSQEKNSEYQILLAGMSLPGDVVKDLPASLLIPLVNSIGDERDDRGLFSRDLNNVISFEKGRQIKGSLKDDDMIFRELNEQLRMPEIVKSIQQKLALPGVETEIKTLAEHYNTPYLLNKDFSLENFTTTLVQNPHQVLHIATHGFFGDTAENSFIMTHDKVLNMNQLESLLSIDYFRTFPLDLITLSACQTAEGDDRAPLGISGIAIKSKVHSALGSLWPVADEATSKLMSAFYEALYTEKSKAKALQKAKIKLLKQNDFINPSFWSPFILVGNWL